MLRPLAFAVATLLVFLPGDPIEPIGTLSDPGIKETSGIVRSRRHPGIFWILSDSGNPPAIHAIGRDGRVAASYRVAIPNIDWEDVAIDDAGHLYLGEIGNNGGLLPLRAVYRIDEPDPTVAGRAELPVTLATYYRFAAGVARFDAESLFVHGTLAYVIQKRFDGVEPELYALPLDPPAPLLRPAVPRRVGIVPGFVEPATGASLTPDGTRLAVVSARVTRVYDRDAEGGLTLRATVRYKEKDIEAIAWDGLDLLVATESGALFRIAAMTWMAPDKARR